MLLFAIATLSPFVLIGLAALFGGVWGWLALGYIMVLVFLLDRLIAVQMHNADPEAEFPAADTLLITLGFCHFALLAISLWAVAGATGLTLTEKVLVALPSALVFGQISHPAAHELIHRPARRMRLLGRWIYTSILFGHHASSHLRVHHIHVGSKGDPNSARQGEGFWRFLLRAWPSGFRAGLTAENRLRRSRPNALRNHPYTLYILGGIWLCLASVALWGWAGLVALVFMATYAQIQILLSDYVQHYGLRRATLADGTLEPVGPQHSWNAPHWYSSAMTLNAPRHSDHHVTPSRPYPALQLSPERMPYLPHSLPVMAVVALLPPMWKRVMDPLLAQWQPRWNERPDVTAGSISPAILARAKAGGLAGADLPNSPHEDNTDQPVPDDRRPSQRPGADDRRRV